MKYFIFILIIIFSYKSSQSKNLFETDFYDVEFISNNIENDKILKIKEIKFKSILNIYKKTLEDENFKELKENISEDLINKLILNIIINDEKIIDNKYLSKIKINFDKKKIIDYYRFNKIPYIEYYPNNFLLIIYENNQLNQNLFTENNKFYSYVKKNLQFNNFFKIPNLDINDRFILEKKDLLNKNVQKIKNFSKKYNYNEAIIILTDFKNNKIVYDLLLYSDGKLIEKRLDFDKNNLDQFFKILEYETINIWKKLNLIQNDKLNQISCKVNYFNIFELKEIRKNLNNVSIIKKVNVKSLSYKNIVYEIYFYGNFKIFSDILNINNLNIKFEEKNCFISLK